MQCSCAAQALIARGDACSTSVPAAVDVGLATFLGSAAREYHWPSPLLPQTVADAVRLTFQFPVRCSYPRGVWTLYSGPDRVNIAFVNPGLPCCSLESSDWTTRFQHYGTWAHCWPSPRSKA